MYFLDSSSASFLAFRSAACRAVLAFRLESESRDPLLQFFLNRLRSCFRFTSRFFGLLVYFRFLSAIICFFLAASSSSDVGTSRDSPLVVVLAFLGALVETLLLRFFRRASPGEVDPALALVDTPV